MRTNTIWATILVSLSILTTLIGCKGAKPPSHEGSLRIQLTSDPVSLDPSLAEDGVSISVLSNLMDGLLGYDGEGRMHARLAKSAEATPDRMKFVFEIRREARWSDGQPVRAEHFVQGIRRALDPATPSKLAELLLCIKGARVYRAGGPAKDLGVRVEDGKLIIELEEKTPYFLHLLTLPTAMPLRADVLEKNKGNWPAGAPTTGAYRVVSYRPDQVLVLERNAHHWNYENPARIQTVRYQIVTDDATASRLFERGKLDILSRVPAYDQERLSKQGKLDSSPFWATYYLAFNIKKRPFGLPYYRRAVSGAVRRKEIIGALAPTQHPARSWIPAGLEGHIKFSDPRHLFWDSIKKVRARIKEIRLGKVEAGFDGNERNHQIMEKVQSDLKRYLGMELELSNYDWKSYVRRLSADAPPLFRFGWMAPFKDPISHLQVFMSDNPNNYTRWKSREYDRMVNEISGMEPGPERVQKIRKAQKLLVDDQAVVVPLYHYVQNHLVSARVEGFRVNPFRVIRLEELRLK